MEIPNPRLTDRIYVGFIDRTHTGLLIESRWSWGRDALRRYKTAALSIPGGKRNVTPEPNAPPEPGTHITH